MDNFAIEIKTHAKIQGSGRKPTSEEYEIGTKVYNDFKVGNCQFFPSNIKYKSLLSRLSRLNDKHGTDYEFTVRKDTELGEIIGGVRSIVEGFRIYRVK